MAQPGDPIILDLALWDRSPSMFVRATLKADGIPMPLSPINVPHLANGRYFYINKTALKFPEDTFEVGIDYEIYSDAGYTSVSPVHAPAKDELRLDPTIAAGDLPPDLINILNEIKQLILAQGLGSDLEANLVEIEEVTAMLVRDEVIAAIGEDGDLEAELIPDELIANLSEEDELIAILEED